MELEFDKEIDALLRKARDSGAAAVKAVASPHVDADAIAAFAENALPAKARQQYVEHFADCDACRRMLSQTISSETQAAAAVPAATAAAKDVVIPWYERLFHPARLAVALGAIVLAFTGLIGYLAIQNRQAAERGDVALVKATPGPVAPNAAANTASSSANSNASAAPASNTEVSNAIPEAALPASPAMRSNGPSASSPDVAAPAEEKPDDKKQTAETADKAPKPVMAAPPPPAAEQPAAAANERRAEPAKLKDEASTDTAATAESGAGIRNDAALSANAPAKRVSGPRNITQNQQQVQIVTGESAAAPRRTVGGRTFEHRDGVWYDTAYHGSATENYRRGTNEYKHLDSGLRRIAESISGTVVIVWKSKAYRIQ